jgi:3-hydroxy-9,10-secoandrosta-1,3,5(10)-triene-9,17-dione monooxygenase reductase component
LVLVGVPALGADDGVGEATGPFHALTVAPAGGVGYKEAMSSTHPVRPTEPAEVSLYKALGRVPSGVFILTARLPGDRPAAMMASWVQQASFSPPAVCVAIGKDRPVRAAMGPGGRFALSILGESDSPLLKKYARGIPPGADPFEGVNVRQAASGLPVLADALAWLDCQVRHVADFGGDHDLIIASVAAGDLMKDGTPFTHVRGSGAHY